MPGPQRNQEDWGYRVKQNQNGKNDPAISPDELMWLTENALKPDFSTLHTRHENLMSDTLIRLGRSKPD